MTGLEPFRRRLDELDASIVRNLAARFDVCREVAEHKRRHDIPMMQSDRVAHVRERYLAEGGALGLPESFTAAFFDLLISATCDMEDELIAATSPQPQRGP
jgi:4-amino-4-deoxychorismate mutase